MNIKPILTILIFFLLIQPVTAFDTRTVDQIWIDDQQERDRIAIQQREYDMDRQHYEWKEESRHRETLEAIRQQNAQNNPMVGRSREQTIKYVYIGNEPVEKVGYTIKPDATPKQTKQPTKQHKTEFPTSFVVFLGCMTILALIIYITMPKTD